MQNMHIRVYFINTSSMETISDTLKGKCETIENYNDLITKFRIIKTIPMLYKKE